MGGGSSGRGSRRPWRWTSSAPACAASCPASAPGWRQPDLQTVCQRQYPPRSPAAAGR